MEFKEMYQTNSEKIPSPHELARKFEMQIKGTVAEKFSVEPEKLSLLLYDKDGVYLSQEESETLCCFVVGQENGFLYLVTAKIENKSKELNNFKADIVS
ncbi:MAG TPA: hypothetical protein DIT25_00515 [Candidatus Moranbacteria bacterium]|nr:hypothetical protein [Candidatus Moranbacteria bacterium]